MFSSIIHQFHCHSIEMKRNDDTNEGTKTRETRIINDTFESEENSSK